MLDRVVCLCAVGLAAPVLAHPHVWIDAEIDAMLNADGMIEAIRVTWTYDDFYTLMIMEERGLDPDGDGVLTDAETASIQGFDMNWQEGYPGDTYALLGEVPVEISRPSDWTAKIEDGFVTTTHVRHLAVPVRPEAGKPLIIQSYDPEYYIAYTINYGRVEGGEDCEAVVHGFDPEMADAALTAASQEYAASTDPNMPFPKIGAAYADEVRVACS
jgi:ABC-type uncharacterized transport system substrate-binding protein